MHYPSNVLEIKTEIYWRLLKKRTYYCINVQMELRYIDTVFLSRQYYNQIDAKFEKIVFITLNWLLIIK